LRLLAAADRSSKEKKIVLKELGRGSRPDCGREKNREKSRNNIPKEEAMRKGFSLRPYGI